MEDKILRIHSEDSDLSSDLRSGRLISAILRLNSPLPWRAMASRLAACEVCRKAKLACDHKRPACTRCENSIKAGICIYRTSPFKRRRLANPSPGVSQQVHSSGRSPSFNSRPNSYPNPGYLGSSSHATIFDHISLDQGTTIVIPRSSDLGVS